MKLLRTGLTAAALAVTFVGGASADPVFGAGTNLVKYINYENEYRATGDCTAATCLAATAGDPTGYTRINPAVANNTQVGDLFIGVLSLTSIFAGGTQTYFPSPGNLFTGYFAQEVTSISVTGATTLKLGLSATTDPFGILAAGEMFRLYSNTPSFTFGGTAGDAFDVTDSINSAKSGTFWASLYDPSGVDGYAYTNTDTNVINSSNTLSFSALDILLKGPGYNAGMLNKVNDNGEAEDGGTLPLSQGVLCNAADVSNGALSCTDFAGESKIVPNNLFGNVGNSPWMFESQDPFYLNKVPEPGSLALIGLALAGLGVVRRRRAV